ncbi:MAG: hypothetical protein RR724_06880, partial [Hydrogenoanaerobacterium sp.]
DDDDDMGLPRMNDDEAMELEYIKDEDEIEANYLPDEPESDETESIFDADVAFGLNDEDLFEDKI